MNLDVLNHRFWAKVSESDNGCWEWTGAKSSVGYGQWGVDGVSKSAHRLTYRVFIADIPAGLVLDHLCRNRACCNPWHLEAIPQRLNTLRGLKGHKTHCVNGHELAGDNLVIYPRPGGERRTCLTCSREGSRRRMQAKRNEQAVA